MKKDLLVFRCKGCIEDLKEYNPYIYKDGTTIPLEKIEVVKVPLEYCENYEKNLNSHKQKPIPLYKISDEEPYYIKYWDDEYSREQGISYIFGYYDSFKKAYDIMKKVSSINNWASCELCIMYEDEEYSLYTYATTEPYADNFVLN